MKKAVRLAIGSVGKKRWKKFSQTVGKKLQPVGMFCAPVESVGKAIEAVGKPVDYLSVRRWILPFQRKTVSVRFRVRGHIWEEEGCSHASINTVMRNELLEAQMFAIDLMLQTFRR